MLFDLIEPFGCPGSRRTGRPSGAWREDRRLRRFVVTEAGIEAGQVEFVIEPVIQGVFEGAGQQLSLQVNSEKPVAGVDLFVARHELLQ